MITSKRMRYAGHVAHTSEMEIALKTMKEADRMTDQGVDGGLRKRNVLIFFGVVQLAGFCCHCSIPSDPTQRE